MNISNMDVNITVSAAPSSSKPDLLIQILVTGAFVVGIIGNIIALVILYRSAKRRNKKHVLMLRWLAINDLVSAVGMLTVTNLKRYGILPQLYSCKALVLLRGFGLGSGTVALLMAMERWFALTRPFLYHKLVTYDVLKRTLWCLWLGALLLTYAPLFGFGLYFNFETGICSRYRFGTELKDRIYAWLNFAVGAIECISIVLCNIAVVMELSKIQSQNRVLVRRISRSLIVNNRTGTTQHYQTPAEVAFAKLMAYISVIFCISWGPQIMTIPIAQSGHLSRASEKFTGVADLLMACYFTLDPFVYVLQRYIEKGSLGVNWCFLRRRKSSGSLHTIATTNTGIGGESMKWTSQDTSASYND